MKKHRMIPLILVKNGQVVQSRLFSAHRPLGLLNGTLERYESWEADEVVIINISSGEQLKLGRQDLATTFQAEFLDVISAHAHEGSMPMTVGGGIDSLPKAAKFFRSGADKVFLNTSFFMDPKLIEEISEGYGSQSVVVGIDYRLEGGERWVYTRNGSVRQDITLDQALDLVLEKDIGEVFIHEITRDGLKTGMDLDVIPKLESFPVPAVLCGGAGSPEDFVDALKPGILDGVAASNYFQHVELSITKARETLVKNNLSVRDPKTKKLGA
jgi:cyclase